MKKTSLIFVKDDLPFEKLILKSCILHLIKHYDFERVLTEYHYIEGILPKGPYRHALRMADRALLAGYPLYVLFVTDDMSGLV